MFEGIPGIQSVSEEIKLKRVLKKVSALGLVKWLREEDAW
jgi:hypothetical protein